MRRGWLALTIIPLGLAGWVVFRAPIPPTTEGPSPVVSATPMNVPPAIPIDDDHDDDRAYVFRMPSGEPTTLTCEEARSIIEQVRSGLASTPGTVDAKALAASTADWLDPHGLLSLAKDAPTTKVLEKSGDGLVADLEGKHARDCASANAPGAALEQWSGELREAFDKGRKGFAGIESNAALEPLLPPTGSAKEVAFEIGRRVGAFEAQHGEKGKTYGDEARKRFFPDLDKQGWARVVLASAVRAYVPLVDPHGEWAPFDEESRIYEVDLAARPPSRLWGRAVSTSVGVRVTDDPSAPLMNGDVVLSVGNIATAGLPSEQVEQLGFAASDARVPMTAVVLRNGQITTLPLVRKGPDPAGVGPKIDELAHDRVAFGDGDTLIVTVKDVRDDLGDELAQLIGQERDKGPRKLSGIVIDLRGNGGGSTDGALGALSLFLPGAPLFAMRRRDNSIEVDRASVPRERDRWNGPLATFVDGSTASAAEMIAGALAAYKRAPTVGTTTFGKGCAQEYVDDDAHAGVLRLTTLVYALPDGSPVQRIGLVPQIRFPFTPEPGEGDEREAKLPHSAPPWRGPDLRDQTMLVQKDETQWPSHGGNVGNCKDAEACKALRLLGPMKRAPVAKH